MIKEAMLYEKLSDNRVHCYLCAHHCKIKPSQYGICGVRQNNQGLLNTLVFAESVAAHVDPIEKKPLYHFLPGTSSYSIATMGCNFKCGFCQNWQISQTTKRNSNYHGKELLPEEVVRQAKLTGSKSISYTYTEPTIFFEYAYETARLAKAQNIYNIFVTNGYMTKEAIDTIKPFLDGANIDLKSFNPNYYLKNCKAKLEPVLEAIKYMKSLGIWIEVTTLVIPGENDSKQEFAQIASFIAGVDKGIPWHISRFHPDYEFNQYQPTSKETLELASDLGKKAGLRYVYLGNTTDGSDSFCYKCKKRLICRDYFSITENNIKDSHCNFCKAEVDGIFS